MSYSWKANGGGGSILGQVVRSTVGQRPIFSTTTIFTNVAEQ
jgi:hypothetical protein